MTTEAVLIWAGEWAEKFDQSYTEEKMRAFVGKRIKGVKPADEEGEGGKEFEAIIVGFSIDTIPTDEADVHRFSVISEEGLQVALIAGMTVEELEHRELPEE